jgi:menaquinol-cytochrome c reductase iron-sulfur subunit
MNDSKTSLDNRRGFLAKLFAILGGGIALLAPAALGAVSFFNPLRQKGQAGAKFKLASLDMLPEDGAPMKFPVIAERVDAWNRYPNESIGAVYLRRAGEKNGKPAVEALQVVCPHAGCSIMHEPGEKGGKFFCPCHRASFDLSGVRTDDPSPSPRDMDSLEVEIGNGGEIFVKFQTFSTGTSQKKAQA